MQKSSILQWMSESNKIYLTPLLCSHDGHIKAYIIIPFLMKYALSVSSINQCSPMYMICMIMCLLSSKCCLKETGKLTKAAQDASIKHMLLNVWILFLFYEKQFSIPFFSFVFVLRLLFVYYMQTLWNMCNFSSIWLTVSLHIGKSNILA